MNSILVTGATGNIGRHLVPLLLDAGASVRALTRSAAAFPAGVTAVRGDLTEPAALDFRADAVFLLWPYTAAEGAEAVVAKIAEQARRVVFVSAMGVPDVEPTDPAPEGLFHGHIEWLIRRTSLEWTFLRAGGFASNTLGWAEEIRKTGVVREIYGKAGRSLIHEADIAAVAARALLSGGHVGARYDLTGPAVLTQEEQLRTIGAAIGRDLRWEEITEQEARESMAAQGWTQEFIDGGLAHWSSIVTDPEPVTDTVERVTGRPARSFAEWANEHAAAFR
jgi:uncharacterized protein YbjT (DUF2867 family)